MAYGIIRVKEITAGEIGSTDIHNARRYEELGIKTPENIHSEESYQNRANMIINGEFNDNARLKDAIDAKLMEKKVKVRSDSVVALEFVVSASPEFWEVYSPSGWFANCQRWLEERYGRGNVVAVYQHYDESNPHAHIILTPIREKEVHWKNAKGEGKKIENRLCARDFTGNKELLSQLQEDYFRFISPYGVNHGVEFYRGTKATNDLKRYTQHTDHRMGKLRAEFNELEKKYTRLQEAIKEGKISPEIGQKHHDEIKRQTEEAKGERNQLKELFDKLKDEAANKEARRSKYNAEGKWKKGFDPFM